MNEPLWGQADAIGAAIVLWLLLQAVAMIAIAARNDERHKRTRESLERLWAEFDRLHPRQGNPGSVHAADVLDGDGNLDEEAHRQHGHSVEEES